MCTMRGGAACPVAPLTQIWVACPQGAQSTAWFGGKAFSQRQQPPALKINTDRERPAGSPEALLGLCWEEDGRYLPRPGRTKRSYRAEAAKAANALSVLCRVPSQLS